MKRIAGCPPGPVSFEPLESRLLLSAPQATLAADDITAGGLKAYGFVVEYASDVALNLNSLDGNDILVTGPGGYSRSARLMSVLDTGNPLAVSAIYRIEAPGGTWEAGDNGTYDIHLLAGQVANTAAQTNLAATLGSITVNAGDDTLAQNAPLVLGTLTGLTVLTNLETVLVPVRRIEFVMTGTGTKAQFIQLDSADEEAGLSIRLLRRLNEKVEEVKIGKGNDKTFKAQNPRSRRISLENQPAGTYIIEVRSSGSPEGGDTRYKTPDQYDPFIISRRNPHFSIAINPATAPTPDLFAAALDVTRFPATLVPGETFNAKVRVTNIGIGKARGSINVELYFSADQTLDDNDTIIGTTAATTTISSLGYIKVEVKSNNISLKQNQSRNITVKATIPSNLPAGAYFIIAKVQTGDLMPEVSVANNSIASTAAVSLTPGFGAFAGREGVIMRYLETDGTEVTLKLTGPGFGILTFNGGVPSILVRNTTAASRLTITTRFGTNAWTIDNFTAGDGGDPATSIGSLLAATTTLLGAATASGTIGAARFKNVTFP